MPCRLRSLSMKFILFALSTAICSSSLLAQNRLVNGTFDRDLSGWEIVLSVSWSPLDARGGNSGSAGISTGGEFNFGYLIQFTPVQPGERLELRASVLAQGTASGNVLIGFCSTTGCVEGDFDEEPLSVNGMLFPPSGGWQTQSVSTVVPEGAKVAAVLLLPTNFLMGNDRINFDDIFLGVDNTPRVIVTTSPEALVQTTAGGATTTYTLQNVGGGPAQITLGQDGTFFQQSPSSFTLAPGATQVVTVTALPSPPGAREGRAIPRVSGVPDTLSIPIRVLTTDPPVGSVNAAPVSNRVDVSSSPGNGAGGTASFTNSGTGTLRGVLVSDVDWIIPQSGEITIPPGQTITVTFTIDPSKRPDAGRLGSATGTIMLVFLSGSGSGAKPALPSAGPGTAASSVVVVHTVAPAAAAYAIPPLQPGEVALFMPGVSHVVGSVGTFLSDVTLTSLAGLGRTSNANLIFRALGNGSPASLSSIASILPNAPVTFADIAKGVFGNSASAGTLQLRSSDIGSITAAATVLNSSNPRGTYGTSIPVFRSDRSSGAGDTIYLTGLLSDATNHSNLYLQETNGGTAIAMSEFLSSSGATLSSRTDTLEAFSAVQLGRVAPAGAIAARITVVAGSTGRLVSYATPVDSASGDTWAVVDWRKQYAFSATVPAVIPVAGSLRGANNTYFRTDLAISNPGTSVATGRLRYYSRSGDRIDRNISLAGGESRIISDVLVSLFNVSGDAVGYLELTPSAGAVLMTSRTYTTVSGSAATFGASVPTVPIGSGLKAGQFRRFGGLEDASVTTIQAGRGATFRTNVGLVEISGQPATIRLTLRFAPSPRSAAQVVVSSTVTLAPHQFLQINGITRAILGANRDRDYGDLRNMQLDVDVVSGAGEVVPFTSSIDNGTGDSVLRVD